MAVTNNTVIGVALGYIEANPDEIDLLRALIVLALHGPPVATRTTSPAHVTCSAALVTADWKVLQIQQLPAESWQLPGGHVTGQDQSLLGSALRHLTEQTGIEADLVIPAGVLPLDVAVYPVEAAPTLDEPEHVHYDACFLLYIDDWALREPAVPGMSHRWVEIGDLPGRLGDKLLLESVRPRAVN